ncbi:MAG: ABC transporter ATP-binding protein [Planctomycetota bacterium]|nr:ABC transporter ATP-binding protein [Planctomycetota bacterium]MDA1178783.1 ABC transporter ATP-binding protein [Planctomycetota bacterium]
MILLNDVSRCYGTKRAVDRLDLHVRQGEVFSFLGPNGAGKTTTIKMMVGLLRPSSGTVTLGGFNVVTHPEEANRLVGYVPDQPFLYDKLSGREFLEFTAELYGLTRAETERCIQEQTQQFRLHGFIDQLTEQYSHGMKQRLVFASAFVHNPAILIVDEPMVGLDPRSMRDLKDLLRKKADEGLTIFMSTHTLPVAEEISDRIGVFHQGKLQFLGTVEELRSVQTQADCTLESLFLSLTRDEE